MSLSACGKDANTGAGAERGGAAESKPAPAPEPLSQAQLTALYEASKARIEATATLPEASVAELEADLRRVAHESEDVHLRANASLLLGHLSEGRGDPRTAISFYRQAAELIPDSVDPHIVLALALAKAERWDEAIAEQWKVVEAIPDELFGWLLLGELHVKGGKLEEAAEVYTAYEQRRKGLLDGLTLKQDGEYVKDEDERAACAEALAPAADNGTALALMYALDSDPSAKVRASVAAVMGDQRLLGYQKLLTDKLANEPDPEVAEIMRWAIAEIEREGIETSPGPVPESINEQVAAQAAELAKAEAPSGDGSQPAPDPSEPPKEPTDANAEPNQPD
jgi:tetratricopeptide (TPR) repeat protein